MIENYKNHELEIYYNSGYDNWNTICYKCRKCNAIIYLDKSPSCFWMFKTNDPMDGWWERVVDCLTEEELAIKKLLE